MTSKSLFFRSMREDLRHKVWMLALSVLGNMLSLPVAYLLYNNNRYRDIEFERFQKAYAGQAVDFFERNILAFAGFIAIAGACIVGFFGFRYLFRRNMVDTYHSMPIRRKTLFFVNYFNGLLIWFIPFLVSLVITVVLALCGGKGAVFATGMTGVLFTELFKSVLALLVSFLLVYHLVLVAVMLSGNVLNSIVSTVIPGVAFVAAFGLRLGFLNIYRETHCGIGEDIVMSNLCFTSPLVSSVHLLVSRMEEQFFQYLLVNFLVTAALGALAYFLYLRRPSELAEQGVANKIATALMRMITAIVSGMGGWLIFALIGNMSMAWGVFGGVLVSVIVFGVLDIIFKMDFKAFFAHKRLMLLSTVLTLAIGFIHQWDLLGYDTYLPKKDKIESLAIDAGFRNRNYRDYNILQCMEYTDTDRIYELLKAGVENVDEVFESSEYMYVGSRNDSTKLAVRVTLTNGRSYYRYYTFSAEDADVVLPIVNSEEYIEHTYRISEAEMLDLFEFRMESFGVSENFGKDMSVARTICEAYNRDLTENREAVIFGEGRQLAQMRLYFEHSGYSIGLDFYEGMKHTIAAIEEAGLGRFLQAPSIDEVENITLNLGYDYWYEETGVLTDYELWARETYGVFGEEGETGRYREPLTREDEILYKEAGATIQMVPETEVKIIITDKAEIAELLALINYETPYYGESIFRKGYAGNISINTADGMETGVTIRKGILPEKYIKRFGELGK